MTEYWKSAPYLVNFMDEYDLKRDFVDRRRGSQRSAGRRSRRSPATRARSCPGTTCLPTASSIPATRGFATSCTTCWIRRPGGCCGCRPPGATTSPKASSRSLRPRALTKRLIFSSWQVVPKVVAALLTYEAERRMLGIDPDGRAG